MPPKPITTPRGSIIQTTTPKGKVSAQLVWNKSFATRRTQNFSRIQKYVDSEVLRCCSPKVPLDTGMLEESGKLGTVIGSGEVQYIAPYAAVQYYNKGFDHSGNHHPDGGALWFERMKVFNGKDIINGAKKMARG